MKKKEVMKIGCFASGRGSNFEAILKRIESGDLEAEVAFLLTNNSKCGAVDLAKSRGIPVHHVSSVTDPDENARTARMVSIVRESGARLLVLCGYMKRIPDEVLEAAEFGAINIHPSLLPRGGGLWGHHVHEAILALGDDRSGATVHRVNSVYDDGEILMQRQVPVLPGDTADTLAARVLIQEHDLLWRVVKQFAEGKLGAPTAK